MSARSIVELERAVQRRGRSLLRDFQQRPWTKDALLNMAFGYVAFARDEKNLFRFLYLEKPEVPGYKWRRIIPFKAAIR